MARFLINKDGVYYLTTGRLLSYDRNRARTDEERADVERVATEFARIRDLPHTWYQAVEISDRRFSAINTGDDD